ncbi:hypothetical protein [Myceligenerans xiligouense]|uniref:Protein kinase domain-containing protein n=1 Tax=Myceligenerans xiligouense TaxID=253184 RepID=A0A3N4YQN8_9MICO|nr:hypothetical protein [Myceligenerans xiligouense]RPF20800.1 hypothetical protein EDD34_1407 [Myceligenerans xiligouense]
MHLIDATELVPVTVPAAGLARDLLVRRLDTLADIDHPSLVRLVTISPSGGDRIDVRLDRPDAADLPTVLASRGPFTAAEASGMVVSVAQALAALHGAGLVHGPVEPTDVLFTPEGEALLRPRLALPAAATGEEPVADVPSLARLAQSVLRTGLTGADGRPAALSGADLALRAELAGACAADPRERPEAGTFAARVYGVVPPARVRMPAPDELVEAARTGPISIIGPAAGGRVVRREDVRPYSGPTPRARRNPLRGRKGAVLAVAAAGLAVGVGAGALVSVPGLLPGGDTAPATGSAQGQTADAQEPRTAAQLGADLAAIGDRGNPAKAAVELTRLRMLLLTGMPVEVSDIDQAGSPAHAADVALLNRIFFWSKQVSGAEVYVTKAEVVGSRDGGGGGHLAKGDPLDSVVVRVEYRISAHMQVGDSGPVQVPESEPRSAMLQMTWTDDGWRVSRVS